MNRHLRTLLLVGVASVLAGCASGSQARDPDVTVRRSDRNVITADEIEQSGAVTAQQAVERLRPHMLQVRSGASVMSGNRDELQIYVDNIRMGGREILASLQAHEIREIRYMSAVDATNRYGTGHSHGAILITRKSR
jgi:type IV pilus biogenesis protein CpaD/CtpE